MSVRDKGFRPLDNLEQASGREVTDGMLKNLLDEKTHGLFATRSPDRPNSIGISDVELLDRDKNVLKVKGVDMLDEKPFWEYQTFDLSILKGQIHRKNVLMNRVDFLTARKPSFLNSS